MTRIETLLAFAFGTCFCIVLLVLAIWMPHPTAFSTFVFRVILSIAAGGVGAVIPGMLHVELPYARAGGAFALAVIVFFFNPPALISAAQ